MATPSLKKNISLSMAYQILTLITPFITTPYIARVLGADGVGVASYTSSVASLFMLFAALGTSSYGTIEIAKVRNDFEKRSQTFWEIETLAILSTLAVLVVWGGFVWMNKQYQLYFLILTLSLLYVPFDVNWFFAGIEEFRYIVYRNFFVKILGIVLLFVFIRDKDDLGLYLFIQGITYLLGLASMWFYLKGRVGRPKLKFSNMPHHFRETLIFFVPTIATSVYCLLDKTLIGVITDNAFENGYYEQATKMSTMVKTVTFSALNSVMMSRQSFLFAEGKLDEMKQRIDRSVDIIMFIGVGACLGVIGIASTFVPLFFGQGYDPVIFLMQLLIPVVLFSGIGDCLGSQYYNPSGLRAKSARYIIAGAVLNLICNLLLIPRLGSVGAVIGTLIAEFFIACLYVYNCNKFLRLSQILGKIWKRLIAGCCMLAVIALIRRLEMASILKLLIECAGGFLTYIAVLFLMRDTLLDYLIKDVIYPRFQRN